MMLPDAHMRSPFTTRGNSFCWIPKLKKITSTPSAVTARSAYTLRNSPGLRSNSSHSFSSTFP